MNNKTLSAPMVGREGLSEAFEINADGQFCMFPGVAGPHGASADVSIPDDDTCIVCGIEDDRCSTCDACFVCCDCDNDTVS